jgi:hypothetical protein
MIHAIRDMEAHLRNTWQFDKWGFTHGWGDKATLSDIDGFYGFMGERNDQFILVEMKHWDGQGDVPKIPMKSGQAIMLWRLSLQPNFSVMLGYGDTSKQQVYYSEVWNNGKVHKCKDFKESLTLWWAWASAKR